MLRNKSLPSWECGLKSICLEKWKKDLKVTPLVGVWIEISWHPSLGAQILVTPLVGVWIEIPAGSASGDPTRLVTPLVGVWIEMPESVKRWMGWHSHSPRGSVD